MASDRSIKRNKWRTKSVQGLLTLTGEKSAERAVVRYVQSVRNEAIQKGLLDGVNERPYDPKPLAIILGAKEVRPNLLDIEGQIISEGDNLVVEYDPYMQSMDRRRFTIAHEVGHLALWRINQQIRRAATRVSSKGSEIEEICDLFASEILAPRQEVAELYQNERKKTLSFRKIDFIDRLAQEFKVSMQFAASRFRKIIAPRIGAALFNFNSQKFSWQFSVPDSRQLLMACISQCKIDKPKGGGSYMAYSGENCEMKPFEWLCKGKVFLIVVGR